MTRMIPHSFRPDAKMLAACHELVGRLPHGSVGGVARTYAIALDTSGGRVTDDSLNTVHHLLWAIQKQAGPVPVELLQFDTQIASHTTVRTHADVDGISFAGMGGTWVQCIFNWYKTRSSAPRTLVVATDGLFFAEDLRLPHDWGSTRSGVGWFIDDDSPADGLRRYGPVVHQDDSRYLLMGEGPNANLWASELGGG